jgi:hypothetical protein
MFMQKIDIDAATPLRPRGKPRSLALKLTAGLAVTLLGAAAMVPWTLLVAAWAGLAMLVAAGRAVGRTILYAGEAVVGR